MVSCESRVSIHHTEVEVLGSVSPLRGFAIPFRRFDRVLRHALTVGIHHAKAKLREGVALVGGVAKLLHGFCGVLRQALAVGSPDYLFCAAIHAARNSRYVSWLRLGGLVPTEAPPVVMGRCMEGCLMR